MNELYLMNHISRQLHTIVRYFGIDSAEKSYVCARMDFSDSVLFPEILSYCQTLEGSLPVLFDVNSTFCYGYVPDCSGFYIIGPIRFADPLFFVHRLQTEPTEKGLDFTADVALCDFQAVLSSILLVYNLYHFEELGQNELIQYCCIPKGADAEPLQLYSELTFQNQEYGQKHNPYGQELREQQSIELGDPMLLKKSLEEDYIGEIGTLSKDHLRNWKYLGATVLTLASRSAIRGGISPEVAFSLQDSYMQKIDETNNEQRILHLIRAAEFTFANMVRELKEFHLGIRAKENPYIEQCKDYIFSHLHDKLEVADIARHLALNANYLSELFHTYEGVTLKSYIQHEKVKLVKNLLTYSRYGYSEIATYLGYSSQSHLGKIFKQTTGYTLSQYRKKFGSPEFIANEKNCFNVSSK